MSILLEIPWEASRYLLSKYSGSLRPRGGGLFLYSGPSLPPDLKGYRTEDFSHARWLEDELRVKAGQAPLATLKSEVPFKPRPHQVEAAKAIFLAHQRGWSGFLCADKTGLGKTLSVLSGVTAIAKKEGFSPSRRAKLLIVCPKGARGVWRQTLRSYGASTTYCQALIINYQQLHKLISKPPEAAPAKGRAAAKGKKPRKKSSRALSREKALRGKPLVAWDFVIADESHYLKNYPSSTVSLEAVTVARLNEPYVRGKSPFVVFTTATPGASPLNLAVLAGFLARLLQPKLRTAVTPGTWGSFLAQEGFAVTKGKTGWTWLSVPWFGKNSSDPVEKKRYERAAAVAKKRQREDTRRIGKALLTPGAPFIARSPTDVAGWPEQPALPLALELDPAARNLYEEAWTRFRKWLKLHPGKSDPQGALVENLRYRQKSSLLKVDPCFDSVEQWVEEGSQVYISVEFLETLEKYAEKLTEKKIPFAVFTGANTKEREGERLRFQKGEAKVILCTVVESISLHAEEILPDGTKATSAPRESLIHDIRQNPEHATQSFGRAHRDGQYSRLWLPYLEGTVEEKTTEVFANKDGNAKTILGAPEKLAAAMEEAFHRAARKGS